MKRIYISHSTKIDYQEELYLPLSKIKDFTLIFPHAERREPISSKDIIKSCSVVIVEASVPSISVGIEAGWADISGIPVIFLLKSGVKVPLSLKLVSKNIIKYDDLNNEIPELIDIINKIAK